MMHLYLKPLAYDALINSNLWYMMHRLSDKNCIEGLSSQSLRPLQSTLNPGG